MKKIVCALAAATMAAAAVLAPMYFRGALRLNNPSELEYPVRGVDVSAYQGEIDWPVLAGQGLDFAFIKATEGSGYVDERFPYNWEHAAETDLRVGAYHFFSFDSAGSTQAENFIGAVEAREGMLPPVVDVEFYGRYRRKGPEDAAAAQEELRVLLDALTREYGMRPILYVTREAYNLLIADGFSDYDIWSRNVLREPKLFSGREWTFWQYSDRGRLDGYNGEEKYIDLNVFRGTMAEFEAYGR